MAPPLPDRLYDPEEDEPPVSQVSISVDDNAQDSGSGYYTVYNDGPSPNLMASPHANLPGNSAKITVYDICMAAL